VERAASADLPAWEGAWTRIGFEAGGREGSLWLPRDIVTAALDRAYPGIDLAGLSPDERAFLVETVERSLLDGLAAATGTELRLAVAEDADAPPDDAMALVLRAGPEHAYPARLACHPVERDRLLRRFAAQPPQPDPIPDLMVPVVFRCGRTALSIEEFSLLEVGCGIAMDDTTLGFQKLVAVVAERYVQTCAWQTIKPTLEGPLLSRADPLTVLYTTNGFAMNDPDFQGPPRAVSARSPSISCSSSGAPRSRWRGWRRSRRGTCST
jgi:flagellar motor switch/type III secretory pathway protein FliN